MSRRNLGVQLQGVRANSQISTPCYTAKEDSIVDEQDDREQSPPSPTMSSPAEKKGKGKVPARDYPQDKRLPAMGQSFEKHEGASSTSHRGATSLQVRSEERRVGKECA